MAISFPNNPSLNDTFTSGGITFTWNGTNWVSSKNTTVLSDTTPQLGGNLDLNSQDITGTGDINITGTITATSFSGDGSALTGAGTTTTAEWTLGADGSNHYTFTGPGVTAGATDPTIYLIRGQTYKFKNRSGGHPFRIQTSFQNTGGTAYNDGITNNAAGNGEDLYWEVRNDTPDVLYYQCTSHTNMSGRINMISGESKVVGLTSTTATARDAGITTAIGSIIYVPDTGMQVYTGDVGGWKTVADTAETPPAPPNVQGSGGTLFVYNNNNIHVFTSTQPFTTPSDFNKTISYTIIGGGGGSQYDGGGGGGAGAWREGTFPIGANQNITVTIGAGGANGIEGSTPGTGPYCNGSPSVFASPTFPTTAPGGGGGAVSGSGGPGGSGGGGRGGQGVTPGTGGTGDPFPGTPGTTSPANGWGGDGGNGVNPSPGGGGGGAGGNGTNGNDSNPGGGPGILLHSIYRDPSNPYGFPGPDGSPDFWFAGGGGGGSYPKSDSQRGAGGGQVASSVTSPYAGAGYGQGNSNPGPYQNGQANSGSGGGGGTAGPQPRNGGTGGSGIVFLAYPTS